MTNKSKSEYPLVSIICVVKNGVKSIKRAIDSILAQDYPNVEIIVQDGVSMDGTLEILQGYGDKIKLISEPDSGAAEAFSRVLSRIKGRFWGSCLADEEMLPDAVSWGVKNLQKNPELAAVYGDYYATDIEGNIINEVVADDFDLTKLICVEVVPPFPAAFFRTSHFRQIQLSEPLENNADYEIWFKLGMKFPIRHMKKTVTKCSWHTGSDSCQAKTYPLQVQSKKRIMDSIFIDPSTPDGIKSLYFRAYSGLLLWASNSLLGNYSRGFDATEQTLDLAIEYYLKSLKYNPDQEMLNLVAPKLYEIGVKFYKKGELEKALKYVELSLKTDLRFPGYNRTRAVILYSLDRFEESREAAEAELKIQLGSQEAANLIKQIPYNKQVVSNRSITEIADIKDEQALIEHILHENPHLKSCLEQDKVSEAALILRDWVSRNINISLGYMLFDPKDPVSSFNCFNKKKGAVWCGGASKFYVMILKLFGIPAATFGYSVDSVQGLSHSTTLICDTTKHNMPIYLIDAYLNYHFADSNSGDILEFCELIKRIRLKQYDSICLVESKVSRPYLAKPGETVLSSWLFPVDQKMSLLEARHDVWIYGPASPKLTTWIPINWPDVLEQLLNGRSLDQFLLDMMLCNPTYGDFGKQIINKAFADKIALANHVSAKHPVQISDEGSVMKVRKYNIKQPHTKGIETLSSKAIGDDQEDIVEHTKVDITNIEKDALVIVIDIHDKILHDNTKTMPDWQNYYEQNIENLCSMLEYCNAHGIKIQEGFYCSGRSRNSRLDHIRFDYTSNDKLDYSIFSHIYFCGISIDQGVVSRSLGYFNLKHQRKTLLKNCSFQGMKYIGPIDYGITKQHGSEMGKFESMEELHKHVDQFLVINKINTGNWGKKKDEKYLSVRDEKYLSVVVASRNDDHGGDTLRRTQIFVNSLFGQCAKHRVNAELILVEWNPPHDRKPLADVLSWPIDNDYCSARVITVPSEIHNRYKHAASLPLYQMIAKNVGICRAKGEFILSTNIDILFSDELFKFFASDLMTKGRMYRVNRFDVDNKVPDNGTLEEQLAFCEANIIRASDMYGTRNLVTGDYHPVIHRDQEYEWAKLNTNACGDFQLMHRDHWFDLRGYPEFDMYSFFLDGILEFMAHFGGAREETLPDPMRIYHIEHNAGWTPESNKNGTLWNRLEQGGVTKMSFEEYRGYMKKMTSEKKPIIFNDQSWGFGRETFNSENRGNASQKFIEDKVEHTKFDITDIEKDALVVVIDIHNNMVNENGKTLPGWQSYYEHNIENLCSLLEYCNAHDIKIQKVLYREDRNRKSRLAHIRFDHTSNDKMDYSKFSHIYFCGISIDQCVVRRPLGYFNLKHPRKTLLKNCSFQGLKYMGPIDYGITKQPGVEIGKFESMEELHKHVDEFLGINKINIRNWTSGRKQQMFQSWIDSMAQAHGRIYYRDQTVQSLSFLTELAHKHKPTKIIELGTATGMSLRAWISATTDTEIVAVDLSFNVLHSNKDAIPLDLSRVKLIEGDILKTDFTPLWEPDDRVLFFIDAHDLDDVPIMNYILQNVVNSLPQGSIVVIDDLWYSSETITGSNDQKVFQWITSEEVDPLQCFEGYYAPYWQGGAFVGFKEAIPLMEWVNRNKIQLHFEHKGKAVAFECNQNMRNNATDDFDIEVFNSMTGKSFYNPLDKVMVPDNNDPADQKAKEFYQLAKELFAKNKINASLQQLKNAMSLSRNIRHVSYAIAVCHARLKQFDIASKALQFEINSAHSHPKAQKLLADINGFLSRYKKGPKQSLPVGKNKSFTKKEKYLSVVVTSRNDDHGGNTLHRTQVFARGFAEQCRRFGLDAELIFVEWNPPADRKRLYEVLDWPDDLGPLTVRFIEVPPEIHNSIGNADKFPLFQMIAKNVGIRRARGKFVLATNIDILFNDELIQFLASKQLDENSYYRIDRHDTYNKIIPTDVDISEQLEFCKKTLVRVQGLNGTKKISEMETDHFKYSDKNTKLHTNACGDFALMSRQMWHAFRAYPELPLWSIQVDGLLLHMAYVAKMRQVILPEPMRIYHIEHEIGWGVISETIKQRPSLDRKKQYEPWCQRMIDQGQPITNNDENWGYAQSDFKEQVISGKWQGHAFDGSTSKNCNEKIHSLIKTFSDINSRLYYRDQSTESLQVMADVVADYKPTKIIELGTLSGISLRTWIATGTDADIIAVDLSFEPLKKSQQIAPLDLSRVMLVQQDILKTDFSQFWSKDDRVIFYVDAHDLENVPIMKHVLDNALPALPEGSCFIVDDLWYCPEAATDENVLGFFEKVTTNEVDSLQYFEGYCAPYWKGGFFIGFREVVELLEYVNRNRIELVFTPGDKAVMFRCSTCVTNNVNEFDLEAFKRLTGKLNYNPVAQYKLLENTTLDQQTDILCKNGAELFGKGKIRDALDCFGKAVKYTKNTPGAYYAQAVCLARLGRQDLAEKMLELEMQNDSVHPRTHILLKDIVNHRTQGHLSVDKSVQQTKGVTIFTMPKAFEGHIDVIQRNAIKSWTKLEPKPEIIIFGGDKGSKEFAREFGLKYIPDVQRNEHGTPLVNDVFQKAHDTAVNDVIAYVNADIILTKDFIRAANRVSQKFDKYLMVGQRWDVEINDHIDFDNPNWQNNIKHFAVDKGSLHSETGIDYFVANRHMWEQIPPFALGRTSWDNWLVYRAMQLKVPVIDATKLVSAIHQDHHYEHIAGGKQTAWNGAEAQRNLELAGGRGNIKTIEHSRWLMTEAGFESNAALLNQKGQKLFMKGDLKAAMAAFNKAAEIEPQNVTTHNILGQLFMQNGNEQDALQVFLSALKIKPSDRETVLNTVKVYRQMNKIEHAEQVLAKYLKDNPDDVEVARELVSTTRCRSVVNSQ